MSSTQHQLIEQCATRLRGIVEALDNIHDTSPHRWSTDLDDVHSSAESLLALIKDQAPTQAAQDLALRTIAEYPCPEQDNMTAANMRQVAADAITGALAFGAQASQPPPADHWLRPFYDIGRAEGQRTQELAMLVRMLASSLKRHAPESNLVARATNYLAAKGLADAALAQPSPAQAEAERPEVVGVRYEDGTILSAEDCGIALEVCAKVQTPLMTVAQHERIVEARWNRAMDLLLDHVSRISEKFKAERDAALANVDALAVQVLRLGGTISFAQHRTDQAGQVPQAWLDVQAERRRQVEAEGWTPEHDDEHDNGEMARAAACYALAGSSAPNDGTAALLVSLAWPWDEQWWKPSTARRDLVKACALALAEIERLDRACISQSPQPGATTASS
ncbi:hypothetical protein [Pseudomonas aeruginosa]|uniref:hypothetical protein n=1 Tax=Pseudomonas aeruginosa TaxID=287 RepID=UPI000A75912A|nr:hypothetical protein [Pseudomonas aeruginosa]